MKKPKAKNVVRLHLFSAWRSTPTALGVEMAERITGPKTATSFNSISNDNVACLLNFKNFLRFYLSTLIECMITTCLESRLIYLTQIISGGHS